MTDEEFERAVREHRDRVHSHAVWLLRDREDARDVAQEAMVRLWQNRREVAGAAARGWLLRTTHHLGLDRCRRRAVRAAASGSSFDGRHADPAPGPERTAASAWLAEHLERALVLLPPRARAAVLLREVEGLSYQDIAETLGVPLGTLKTTLHRARERLRETLAREGVRP